MHPSFHDPKSKPEERANMDHAGGGEHIYIERGIYIYIYIEREREMLKCAYARISACMHLCTHNVCACVFEPM